MFSTVGVSLDWAVDEGVERLRNYYVFDEVIVGRNWLNTAAVSYMWRDYPGDRSIPQVVLLANWVVPIGPTELHNGTPVELARIVGASDLKNWIKRGYPVRVPSDSVPLPATLPAIVRENLGGT